MTPLEPPTRFELNRMAHAMAQETRLPGSPAGKSGHKQLSITAKSVFGVKSWGDLSAEQMESVCRFLDEHKRLPIKGEV